MEQIKSNLLNTALENSQLAAADLQSALTYKLAKWLFPGLFSLLERSLFRLKLSISLIKEELRREPPTIPAIPNTIINTPKEPDDYLKTTNPQKYTGIYTGLFSQPTSELLPEKA